MAWIETVNEERATGAVSAALKRVRDPDTGKVDAILEIHSLHPECLSAHFDFYRAVMQGSRTMPRRDRELIAFLVSQANGCHY